MHITDKRTKTILFHLLEKHSLEQCLTYGERGYTQPEKCILFANWNPISRRILDYLEEAGFKLEWSDEWYIDYENDKAWRTSPDSYGWVCQIVLPAESCEYLTPDDGAEAVIDALAMTDKAHPTQAVPDWVTEADIEALGYTPINGVYEHGFHPGQTDDPREIAEKAFAAGAEAVVFRIKHVGQFDVHFQGFQRMPEDVPGNN
jgi:hypothetical protein